MERVSSVSSSTKRIGTCLQAELLPEYSPGALHFCPTDGPAIGLVVHRITKAVLYVINVAQQTTASFDTTMQPWLRASVPHGQVNHRRKIQLWVKFHPSTS